MYLFHALETFKKKRGDFGNSPKATRARKNQQTREVRELGGLELGNEGV
jgi:hypothetical protein